MFQIKWIWHNLKGHRVAYVLGLLFAVFGSATLIINPFLSQKLIDDVFMANSLDLLVPLVTAMIVVTLIRTSLNYTMVVLLDYSSQGMLVTIRERIYRNLQKQEPGFYDRIRTGDLITRLTGDLDMVRHVSAYVMRMLLTYSSMFIAVLAYFFSQNPLFTLSLLAITPIIAAVTYLYSKKIGPLYADLRERLSNLNTGAQENISGNRVVKAFAKEDYEIEKFEEKNNDFREANLKTTFTWLKFFPILETLGLSMTIITVCLGGLFIIQGRMTPGELAAFSSLTWAISDPMRMLGMLLNDLQRFFPSASKVIEVYYAHPKILNRDDAHKQEHIEGLVEFDNVSFSYGDNQVFDGISFTAKPGETVAIMGATGSGKTSLIHLIPRFYDVDSGRVLVDGVDVRDWNLQSLRGGIGMATQDVFLFSDTIEGNIAYGDPKMSNEQVKRFAHAAAAGFIDKTEDGFDTIVGERGVGLSGGQKQRIALARALAVRPSILILDDTTSAVDMETEKFIQQQLASLDFPCTKFIIAQRITSVKNADKILVLDGCKITEMGTHEELLAKKGFYYELYTLQHGEPLSAKAGDL